MTYALLELHIIFLYFVFLYFYILPNVLKFNIHDLIAIIADFQVHFYKHCSNKKEVC